MIDKPKKIEGFDKWEVEEGARTLIRAQEIKAKPKFFKVVIKEVQKQAEAAKRAALEKQVAAKLIKMGNK